MSHRLITAAAVSLLALVAAACGGSAEANDDSVDPAGAACLAGDDGCFETGAEQGDDPEAGMCVPDSVDCVDTSTVRCMPGAVDCNDTPNFDPVALDAARDQAQGLLGVAESEVPADVRIDRRGDEYFPRTEDYVIGRLTVVLDDTDGSGYRVVLVALETPDGTEAYELTPG